MNKPSLSPAGDSLETSIRRRTIRTDLDPVRRASQPLDIPPPERRIQVVGTNGKGSAVLTISRALLRSGYRSLALLSPHLHHPRERFLINGVPMQPGEALHFLSEIRSDHPDLTPFEWFTMGAYRLADRLDPDFLLMEAGMGGRWDATSARPAAWLVHTGVEREHTAYLGETLPEIIHEQLIQLPEGGNLLVGDRLDRSCRLAVNEIVKQRSATCTTVSVDPMENQAVRFARVLFDRLDIPFPPNASYPRLPGRFEQRFVGKQAVPVLFDVAHTPGAVSRLVRLIKENRNVPEPRVIVYGGNEDKFHREILRILDRELDPDCWIFPRLDEPRSLDPAGLTDAVHTTGQVLDSNSVFDAVENIGKPVLVTGGFSVVRLMRNQGGVAE